MTTLTEETYRVALSNRTREEKALPKRLVKGPHPQEAIRLLELKHEFPSAQLVEPPAETKGTVTLRQEGAHHVRSEQLSTEWTDEAIAKVDAGTPEEWKQIALIAVEKVCRTKLIFTPDDVWATGLQKPPNPRALGPIMQQAAKLNWCKATGAFVPSQIPTQHKNPIREWKSLIMPHGEQAPDYDDDEIGTLL